jgi:Zn finger protein HypA/HybF involved in hydrogenase expression
MRELQIVESILINYVARFRRVEKSAFIIFLLRLVNSPNLTQPPFKHTGKKYSKGTLSEQTQLHIRLITADVQCMACLQKYRPMDKKNLLPILPLPGVSAQEF